MTKICERKPIIRTKTSYFMVTYRCLSPGTERHGTATVYFKHPANINSPKDLIDFGSLLNDIKNELKLSDPGIKFFISDFKVYPITKSSFEKGYF